MSNASEYLNNMASFGGDQFFSISILLIPSAKTTWCKFKLFTFFGQFQLSVTYYKRKCHLLLEHPPQVTCIDLIHLDY